MIESGRKSLIKVQRTSKLPSFDSIHPRLFLISCVIPFPVSFLGQCSVDYASKDLDGSAGCRRKEPLRSQKPQVELADLQPFKTVGGSEIILNWIPST